MRWHHGQPSSWLSSCSFSEKTSAEPFSQNVIEYNCSPSVDLGTPRSSKSMQVNAYIRVGTSRQELGRRRNRTGSPLGAGSTATTLPGHTRSRSAAGWAFITRATRKVSEVGGSLRDVQQLAGHTSLQTTLPYVGDSEAKRKLVKLVLPPGSSGSWG